MKIRFYANEKKYGKKAVNIKPINLEITSVKQVIEAIRDGFIPIMNETKMQEFLMEMAYRELDKGTCKFSYRTCTDIINMLVIAYEKSHMYNYNLYSEHVLMLFNSFLKTGVIDFQKILAMY